MSKTSTSDNDRLEQPTTAADVASKVIQSVDAASFDVYSGQTRQSILALLERLVQADQGARLAVSGSAESSETAARRQLIVDLLAPQGEQSGTGGAPSEQEVSTLTQNVADARVLSGEDSTLAEQFVAPSLIEMAVVIPGRSPVFRNSPDSVQQVADRLNGSGDRLLGEVLRYARETGGQQSHDEEDPCPFFGPTAEEIQAKQEARVEARAEIEARMQEHYLAMADDLDGFLEAVDDHEQFMSDNRQHSLEGASGDRLAVFRAAKHLRNADDQVLRDMEKSCVDLDPEIKARQESRQ